MEHTRECKQIKDRVMLSLTQEERTAKLACPHGGHDTLRAWYKGCDPAAPTLDYVDYERGAVVYKNPVS